MPAAKGTIPWNANAVENLEVVEFGAHTASHHAGTRKSYDARKTMEAFAQLREELRAERVAKADLLEALREIEQTMAYSPEGGHEALAECHCIARAAIAAALDDAPPQGEK
jgi:hypothetical protein